MNLTVQEARDAINGDHEDFDVITESIDEVSRWSISYSYVLKQLSTGQFWRTSCRRGATEQQDERPWEYDSPEFEEVFPVFVTVTQYVTDPEDLCQS